MEGDLAKKKNFVQCQDYYSICLHLIPVMKWITLVINAHKRNNKPIFSEYRNRQSCENNLIQSLNVLDAFV